MPARLERQIPAHPAIVSSRATRCFRPSRAWVSPGPRYAPPRVATICSSSSSLVGSTTCSTSYQWGIDDFHEEYASCRLFVTWRIAVCERAIRRLVGQQDGRNQFCLSGEELAQGRVAL